MRRFRQVHLFAALLASSAFAAVALGCEDSETGGAINLPPPVGIDSGSQPPIPNPDGGDPSLPDVEQPKSGLTVTVVRASKPAANVRVLSHDAAGATTADQKTGVDGKVTFPLGAAPSQITVVARVPSTPPQQGDSIAFVTYVGVADGDTLFVDDSMGRFENAPQYAKVSATLPGAGPGGAFNYNAQVTKDCNAFTETPTSPLEVNLIPRCVRTKTNILGTAAGGNAPSWAWLKGQTPPAKDGTLNATLGPWTAGTTFTIKAANIPNGATTGYTFIAIADDSPFTFSFLSETGNLADPGGVVFQVPPAGFADALQASVYAEIRGTDPEYAFLGLVQRVAPTTAESTFDLAQMLPKITNYVVSLPTQYKPEATWSSTTPLDGVSDGGYVRFNWTSMVGPDAFVRGSWTFVIPPNATSVKAPTLPADIAMLGPPSLDGLDFVVAFAESALLPGYRELKALPVYPAELGRVGDLYEPIPLPGSVRVTATRQLLPSD
jgi:hypothetical protein